MELANGALRSARKEGIWNSSALIEESGPRLCGGTLPNYDSTAARSLSQNADSTAEL